MHNYGGGAGTSHGREYQGYPYVNPIVIDVPSIGAEAAARYTNLPRKPAVDKKHDSPVVYIDIPNNRDTESAVSQPNTSSTQEEEPVFRPKADPDDAPVVYIDLPDSSASDVAERRPAAAESQDQEFVQSTIFYDPFKDRRIGTDTESNGDDSSTSGPSPQHTPTLGSTDRGCSSSQQHIPPSLSKEASVYRPIRSPEDLFPNDTRDFPEPPPAYTERATEVTMPPAVGANGATVETPEEPPRTQVITTGATDSAPTQKVLFCMFCGLRCGMLTIKEAGPFTHLIAIAFLMIGMFPMTIYIYFSDSFKYNNYYCKSCNAKIAYDVPMLCQDLTYVTN